MDELPRPDQALLEALASFVARLDLEGRFLYVNRFSRGHTREHVIGTSIFEFATPEYHPVIREAIERVIATRAPTGYSILWTGAMGELVPFYTVLSPVLEVDEAGLERVASIALLSTDVSHVTDVHRALEASEAKLRLVLVASRMGTWSYDPSRGVTHWDAALAAIFGYPAAPRVMTNTEVLAHLHPDDAPAVVAITQRMWETGGYGPHEHRIRCVDGSIRWVSATGLARPLGGTLVMVGSSVDITSRKLQEERLAQAERLDSIGRLAGGIAHDFNNMLTAILGYTELAIRAATAGRMPAIEDLREIERAAERSRELTSRLLAFARKQHVDQRVVDPDALVGQLERLLHRIVGEDVALVTTLGATRNIRIDPSQLEQLLLNLVTNARDAMPHGGRLAIETSDVAPDEGVPTHVRIRVTDTGVGIPPEQLAHVFEPFFTTKDVGRGTGLGLAQCYGIARQAGGELRITSELGVGTQVTLDLPAVADQVEEAAPRGVQVGGGTETILLVEDEAQIRELLARTLGEAGYRVLAARDGHEALALVARHAGELDALVTDMVMPGLSGLELATRLREDYPRLTVLVMTGYAPRLPDDPTLRLLRKPFASEELLASLRAALPR